MIAFFSREPGDLTNYFHDSIRYPDEGLKKKKEVIVHMKFEIIKDGKLINIHTTNDVPRASIFCKRI